jgi:hypothetical protein
MLVIEKHAMAVEGFSRAIRSRAFCGFRGLRLGFLGLGLGRLYKSSSGDRSRSNRADNKRAAALIVLAHDFLPRPSSTDRNGFAGSDKPVPVRKAYSNPSCSVRQICRPQLRNASSRAVAEKSGAYSRSHRIAAVFE